MTKSKIVSIICPGHSGSTLLDMVLGTLPNVVSSGEIVYIPWKIYKENNPDYATTYCSCGETMGNCLFWGKILSRLSDKLGYHIYDNPKKFNISINRPFYYGKSLKASLLRKIMIIGSFFININHLVSLLYIFYLKSIKNNWLLFDTISEVSGKNIIIDSTKDIYRYLFLRKQRNRRMKLIILIRDVYGVVSSSHYDQTKHKIKLRAKHWLRFYNLSLYNVIKHLNKSEYLVIRYSDLAKNVNTTRKKIAEFLEITEPVQDISTLFPSQMHIVAGNPVRNKKKMDIKYDERWKQRLSKDQIEDLSIINSSLNAIYSND